MIVLLIMFCMSSVVGQVHSLEHGMGVTPCGDREACMTGRPMWGFAVCGIVSSGARIVCRLLLALETCLGVLVLSGA